MKLSKCELIKQTLESMGKPCFETVIVTSDMALDGHAVYGLHTDLLTAQEMLALVNIHGADIKQFNKVAGCSIVSVYKRTPSNAHRLTQKGIEIMASEQRRARSIIKASATIISSEALAVLIATLHHSCHTTPSGGYTVAQLHLAVMSRVYTPLHVIEETLEHLSSVERSPVVIKYLPTNDSRAVRYGAGTPPIYSADFV